MPLNGIIFLCVATVAWGGMFPAAKLALASLDPVVITSMRYLAVSLLLVPFVRFGGERIEWGGAGMAGAAAGGVIGIAGFNVLMLYGLQRTSPERAAIVMAMLPITTGILRWIVGKGRLTWADIASLLTASLGIVVLVSHGNALELGHERSLGGELLVVAGMLCWACYTLITERARGLSPSQYTTVATTVGSVALAVFLLIAWGCGLFVAPNAAAIRDAAWPLAYMVSAGGLIAILAWSKGVRLVGSLNAALFMNLIPVTAFVVGVFAGHRVLVSDLLGGMLVIAALIAHNISHRQVPDQLLNSRRKTNGLF
jgi:drug/metabolite transporter (DMT)-like permease